MHYYLTYNDLPGGVFQSQVIDVCRFLREDCKANVRLLALVSGRHFWSARKAIRSLEKSAIVLPMIPFLRNWRWNAFFLAPVLFFLKRGDIIARGPFAFGIADVQKKYRLANRLIYDGRDAYAAEVEEYNLIPVPKVFDNITEIESRAVLSADFRIAVTESLVKYWKEKFGYNGRDYVVIPALMGREFERSGFQSSGSGTGSVILAFSGSRSVWQSLDLVDKNLCELFSKQPDIELNLFMKDFPADLKIVKKFPGRVHHKWVEHSALFSELEKADYGILFRERSVTNRCASPVKFAEYLAAGLPVIVSEELGDYSAWVKHHDLGVVIGDEPWPEFKKPSQELRQKNRAFALRNLTRSAYRESYKKALLG